MMNGTAEQRFMDLVDKYGGFEFYQAYRDDVDHVLGGKNGTYWYVIMKNGKVRESWIGKCRGGEWEDRYLKGSGASAKAKAEPAGSVIKRIAEKAFLMQDEPWVTRSTPRPRGDAHPHYHYVHGFGDKALYVSVEYGVTISYSDVKDEAAGFHLRYLYTGKNVSLP
ncbi:MAG: hypothetical protein J6P71_05455 [Oscillospiraceae bacterium]|nr:hypothetical protein [Oscillospiraceae bacterium]